MDALLIRCMARGSRFNRPMLCFGILHIYQVPEAKVSRDLEGKLTAVDGPSFWVETSVSSVMADPEKATLVVHGRIIFPGAGYLETARAAATSGSALRGVFFLLIKRSW